MKVPHHFCCSFVGIHKYMCTPAIPWGGWCIEIWSSGWGDWGSGARILLLALSRIRSFGSDFLAALETTPPPQGSLSPQGAQVILQRRGRCNDVCLKCLFWAMGVLREVIGLALSGVSGGTQHWREVWSGN